MKIKWVRGNHRLSFNRPDVWFGIGQRGTGKSSFLEHVACNYIEKSNACICDLFGSRDGEGLAWLRSPYAKEKKILLLKGENVDVVAPCDVKQVDRLRVRDFEDYDIVISSSPLYISIDQEFIYAARVTDLLYKRLHYKRLVNLICREAANFYYSRLKVSDNQVFAKAQMIYLIREARHMGITLSLDSVRFYAIDIDIRSLADFMVLKAQGLHGLAKDLKWLYSLVNPHLVRKLRPNQFLLLASDGSVGYGIFPEVEWHKKEREDIMRNVGVHVEYGEELKEGEYRGSFKTVSDKEHVEIIRLYVEENFGMTKIGEKIGRSGKTTMDHVHKHNNSIVRSGFCPSCKRAGSPFHKCIARKGQAVTI